MAVTPTTEVQTLPLPMAGNADLRDIGAGKAGRYYEIIAILVI